MFYPIMLDIKNRDIVVIGGGKVGYRKATNFLNFEGKVKVISEHFFTKFYELENKYDKNIILIEDTYKKEYIKGSFLVVAATSSARINERISKDCDDEEILCNVVDSLENSNFICPSFINKGDLLLAISTMGKCPFLSKKIREDLEKRYSKIDEEYIILLGKVRNIILSKYNHKKDKLLKYCLELNKEELKDFYEELIKGENI
ncbi:precorrin-2 dehydrogenase/sirohydrochlorin ferrochelatase [Keratinibaculum paraultunense]|uniref:precorrin-2 dehydrogenase n=1 Tax=Keratinibaculum paraultunense TaxID=1278232 RepID=A0A4R3KS46_9FIRM|nr:bifunctional precorrin-2 dehydrogenase/sirohydrochlorin ferrochelatase [Keratinibaculum paraultunense]QQY79551.1 bifunctional precorrin-2 dehydrogenase/sirohydrochlorin ferrochelatase [Keratinibaculum paraultunense]TCS87576.1 precorrin-2 dehydrogenase/sirohydrochlorin ferrochelatase [Keratinibaculum paraultunense]